METTKVGVVEKSKYELKCEKDRDFQWQMVEALVYYCSNNGKDYLPVGEEFFLTAVILGLADIANVEHVNISHYHPNPQYWGGDIEGVLDKSFEKLMGTDGLPITLYKTLDTLKKVLDLKWDERQTVYMGYTSLLMTFFKDIRFFSNCGDKTWKLCQQQIMDIEKKLIPHLLSSSWSTLHFIKILAEKTKKHLKEYIEAKSYIDRE